MKNRFLSGLLTAAMLVFHSPGWAEDIDLFVQPPPTATDLPNVLILLDNTANWNTAFTNEIASLVSTVNSLPVKADGSGKFRVGLMLFTETGGSNSNSDGGYIRAAMRELNSDNKPKYMDLLNSLDKLGDKSNGGKLGKTMVEAYRYFYGMAPYAGNGKVKTDYTGNTSGTAASNAIYALSNNALASKNGSPYRSPVLPDSCAKNFIIYISNGAAQDNTSDIAAATTELGSAATAAGISGATTAIPISPSGSQDNVGDEWAKFLRKSSHGIVTYTVDVDKITTGQGPGWTALLKSMASVSNGKYFSVSSNGADISNALNTIFSEIQSVNSVFASVSLPVSVNTQGTYLNQIFIGMFRPDGNGLPRWSGNLKQYKLGVIGSDLKTLDAAGNSAINSNTGFITECARSFWTPTTVDSYWSFNPQGGCLTVANSDASNYPDGNIVEKGAQAYQLRSTTNRPLKTCSSVFASCTALTDFSNSITPDKFGLTSTNTSERDTLVNWEKGLDVGDENQNQITTTEMRPSIHADVVHSRPVAINFGSDTSPQVVVFYGGNDGILRAVNGNRTESIGTTVAAGSELFAFVAPEFYSQIKRLRDNQTTVSYRGTIVTSPTPQPKPYGFDGPVTADKTADHAWIYAAMRRGGRVLYAFDFSDLTAPTLKWKKGCPNQDNDTDCSAGFSGIGQTWSSAKLFKSFGYDSGAKPMLIMGGGYDTCEDSDPHTCTSSAKGRHVYVLDANTGTLLKTFDTDRPVVADVFTVPDPASTTGLAKWAYVVDLGGNIYRISGMSSAAPASWTMTKIAALGCGTAESCSANRKFLYAPDVVKEGNVYSLLVGSGDREKPLASYTSANGVSNYFFMVKDNPSDPAWLTSETGGVITLNSLLPITTSATPSKAELATKKGWYLGLSAGEQVVTSAITVFGTTTFSTHTPTAPTPGACVSNLGTARVYNIAYANAAGMDGTRYQTVAGGGLPPSPVAGMVKLDGPGGPGTGPTVPFVIGAKADSPLEGGKPTPPTTTTQPKGRAYWYIQD